MIGATLCSGIGAPECACPEIRWAWASEIDPFASAVHGHHYPGCVNLGDMTAEDFIERAAAIALPDVIVAGTPCQAFSIAGLRKSLGDDRGNLTLRFVRIVDAIDDLRRDVGKSPAFVVWENVPGVLSVGDNAFGTFLGGLVGHDAAILPPRGRGWTDSGVVLGPRRCAAWRVLDAQHFKLAQRRRRVFVVSRGREPVGGAGDWAVADALLPVIESLSWNPPPRREAGQEVARPVASGSPRGSGYLNDADIAENLIAHTLNAKGGSGRIDGESETFIAHSLRADGFDASEDGTGRGTPLVAQTITADMYRSGGATAGNNPGVKNCIPVAFSSKDHGAAAVRRLTPREAERLQGFPDDYSLVTYRGKPAADGPRYRALGNSMAVPVMRWILSRVLLCDAALRGIERAA